MRKPNTLLLHLALTPDHGGSDIHPGSPCYKQQPQVLGIIELKSSFWLYKYLMIKSLEPSNL